MGSLNEMCDRLHPPETFFADDPRDGSMAGAWKFLGKTLIDRMLDFMPELIETVREYTLDSFASYKEARQAGANAVEPFEVRPPSDTLFLKYSEEYKALTASAPAPFTTVCWPGLTGISKALFLVDNMLGFVNKKEEANEFFRAKRQLEATSLQDAHNDTSQDGSGAEASEGTAAPQDTHASQADTDAPWQKMREVLFALVIYLLLGVGECVHHRHYQEMLQWRLDLDYTITNGRNVMWQAPTMVSTPYLPGLRTCVRPALAIIAAYCSEAAENPTPF